MMKPNEILDEELSAYLDGELDPKARRHVEEQLARDPDLARRLQRLEAAWSLLDRLPRPAVPTGFANTTLQMAAIAAAPRANSPAAQGTSSGMRRAMWWWGSIAAAMVGFWIGRQIWPDPNAALLRDLAVIENLELYRQADSIEFARLLVESGLFADDGEGDG